MKDIEKHREELSNLLRPVLDLMGPKLTCKDRKLFAEFVDNYEFGVAVEWLEAAATDQQLEIPPAAWEAIAAAKSKMGMDL